MPTLTYRQIERRYDRRTVLEVDHAQLSTGCTMLLGPNGAGKTTLLRALATLDRRSADQIDLDGISVTESKAALRGYRRHLGWMPQEFRFPAHISVEKLLTHVAWLKQVPRSERKDRVEASLEAVELTSRARDAIGSLSGGMRRRVGIAQAIVNQPSVVLLDEPTVGLDPDQREEVGRFINRLAKSSIIVVSSHLFEDLLMFGDSVQVLVAGAITYSGPVGEFVDGNEPSLDSLRAAYLERTR